MGDTHEGLEGSEDAIAVTIAIRATTRRTPSIPQSAGHQECGEDESNGNASLAVVMATAGEGTGNCNLCV